MYVHDTKFKDGTYALVRIDNKKRRRRRGGRGRGNHWIGPGRQPDTIPGFLWQLLVLLVFGRRRDGNRSNPSFYWFIGNLVLHAILLPIVIRAAGIVYRAYFG